MKRHPWLLALALLTASTATISAAAPRLVLRGSPLTRRESDALLAPALRAPADSLALGDALGRLIGRLHARGWLSARASGRYDPAREQLDVRVEAGERVRLAEWRLDVGDRADSARVAGWMAVEPGGWAEPGLWAQALDRALRGADAAGHPYARFALTRWVVDSARLSVALAGTLGPAVSIEDVRVEGLGVTRPELAARAVGRIAGLPYHPALVRSAESRLERTGLFSSVAFLGLETISDPARARLAFRVTEPRYNRFEGAVGVQGEAGAVGLARLELGNLLGTGRAVGLSWQSRGRGLADFGARFAEPFVLGLPLRLEASLLQQVQDTLYTRSRWGGRATWAFAGEERLELGFEGERVVQPQGAVQTADYQNTTFAVERDGRDDLLDPRRGSRARLSAGQVFKRETLRPTIVAGASRRSARASTVETRVEWHLPATRRSGLALELSASARFSSERVLPDYERQPVGGAATLRGYDEEAFRVDRVAGSRVEWRLFPGLGRERVLAFWDHAWMATRRAVGASDRLDVVHADGFGVGLRLPAAGGLLDLDYGLAPGRGFSEGKLHLRLVTAF